MAVVLNGCGAGWHRPADTGPQAFAPRQQAQIWVAGRASRVHAVVLTADSVSAIPFRRPTDCDSCRVAWPRAEVDSIRVGNPMAGFWKTVGLVVGIPLGVVVVACAAEGGCPTRT
jgi:hypothetical protein